jgi:hypothetical protein
MVVRSPQANDCPDAASLAAAVERLSGAVRLTPEQGTEGLTSFTVRFLRRDDAYSAVVEARGALVGERIVDDVAPSCDGLVDAVAVTLSLLLDELPKHSPPSEAPLPPPAVSAAESDRAAPSSSEPRSDFGRLAASGGILAGIVRPVAPAMGLAGQWGFASHWSAEASTHWIPQQELPLPPGEVFLSFVAFSALACWAPLSELLPIQTTMCAGLAAGALWGRAQGFTYDSSSVRFWFAAQLEVRLSGQIAGPLGWTLVASPMVPLKPQSFSVDGLPDGIAYGAAPVSFLGEAGLTLSSKL